MKTVIYTLAFIIGLISCKSVEKMVEKGEYDKAFSYAINKLRGEKNKKTEYVKALEKAYFKLNSASVREISKLNAETKPENWSRVLDVYKDMENRQERLEPLVPLVSEDGYVASFNMKSYRDEIIVAEDNTCLYYYNNANALISKSEKTGVRLYARDAYDELKKIEKIKSHFRDSEKLKEKALVTGLTRIDFEIINDLRDFHSNTIERELSTMAVSSMDDLWHDFSMGKGSDGADYVVILELNNINFSPERERVHTYTDNKELLIKKDKVKETRDSTVVFVEKEVYEKVRADVTEIFREKKSELHGVIRVMDTRNREYVKTIPVNVYYDFAGYGCRSAGDERALSEDSKKKMDAFLENFPTDFMMADDLAKAFKNSIMNELRKISLD